jgi:hypothetical protein
VEDGETVTEADGADEDERWAVNGIEYDFDMPVFKDLRLVITKTEDLLEAAALTVSLTADDTAADRKFNITLHFDGAEDTERISLKNGQEATFRMPVGTAYELTVQGDADIVFTAQVQSDGTDQDEANSTQNGLLTVSSALGAGENRVKISASAEAKAQTETKTETKAESGKPPYLWIAVAAAGVLAAGAGVFFVLRRKKH